MFRKNKEEVDNNIKVTKEDIISYINKMNIKRAGLGGGGLDKVDVYFHIQQIVTMYDAYLKSELKVHEDEIATLKGIIESGNMGQGQQGFANQTQNNGEQLFTEDEIHILKELAQRNTHLRKIT